MGDESSAVALRSRPRDQIDLVSALLQLGAEEGDGPFGSPVVEGRNRDLGVGDDEDSHSAEGVDSRVAT